MLPARSVTVPIRALPGWLAASNSMWEPDPVAPGRYVVRFTFQRLDDSGRVAGFASELDSEPFEHALAQTAQAGVD
jgi:hypothetical protein